MAGSEQDRNREDGFHLAVTSAAGGTYLGDPDTVNRLVRQFMQSVFQQHALFHESGDGAKAEAEINRLAAEYGRIFLGEAPAYQAMPWNSPHRLGAYLRAVVEDAADHPNTGEAYFHFLAVQAINASIALAEDAMPEAEVQAGLTEVVGDAVDVLLGRKAGAA